MDRAKGEQLRAIGSADGCLVGTKYRCSPHQDDRPDGVLPELIIIHGISLPPGQFGGPWIERIFMGELDRSEHPYFEGLPSLAVSAHVLIGRDGDVTQFVPFHRRAWHAGQSQYGSREACNDFSIGIELEGGDELPYEYAQYQALCEVVATLLHSYPTLAAERIVGHEHVAPGRKTDPGPAFDWEGFRTGLDRSLAARAEQGQSVGVAQGDAPGDGG